MITKDLKKFIIDNDDVEYRWQTNNDSTEGTRDVLMFVHMIDIREFKDLLTDSIFDVNNTIKCEMTKNYFTFWMREICRHYCIQMEEVFGKDNYIYG